MTTSATRKATNAVWRGDGAGRRVAATVSSPTTAAPPSPDAPAATDEVYLDTPRAFVRNLNMVAATVRGVTEADKYLDSNSFSWNLDSTKKGRETTSNGASSSPSTPSPRQQRQQQQQQYLDKPRPFKSNIDMVSSNFSGAKFKRSSDIPPELKNVRDYYDITSEPWSKSDGTSRGRGGSGGSGGMEDAFDITRAPLSKLDRTSSVVRDANIAAFRVRPNGKQSRVDDEGPGDTDNLSPSSAIEEEEEAEGGENEERQPAYDDVMYWLLTLLPNIQEDDAISYFHHLLEDGFDNIDILKEIIDDDLYFMKKGHRRALMRSLSNVDVSPKEETADYVAADNEIIVDLVENITLDEDYAIGRTKSEANEGSWIAEQDQLDEKSLAAGLAEMEKSAVTPQRSSSCVDEELASDDEEYEDISRCSFVDKPSPSSAILPSSAGLRSKRRATPPYIEKDSNEEVFDISLSAATDFREPLTTGQKTRSKKADKYSGSSTDGMAPSVNTPSSSPLPSYDTDVDLAPRAELHQFYIKKGLSNEQTQTLKSYFTTWTNGAKSHELKFTCIFTCPVTGEHFASGDWRTAGSGTDEMFEVPSCQTYWYSEFCFNHMAMIHFQS